MWGILCSELLCIFTTLEGYVIVFLTPSSNEYRTSLSTPQFANRWKTAVVLALLKKPGLDLVECNYCPIANLPYVSKLTEKTVFSHLEVHSRQHSLIPVCQSACRTHHSTETALLQLHHDLLLKTNRNS